MISITNAKNELIGTGKKKKYIESTKSGPEQFPLRRSPRVATSEKVSDLIKIETECDYEIEIKIDIKEEKLANDIDASNQTKAIDVETSEDQNDKANATKVASAIINQILKRVVGGQWTFRQVQV